MTDTPGSYREKSATESDGTPSWRDIARRREP